MGQLIGQILGAVLGVIAVTAIFAILLALPTMWVWNWLMPVLFGLKTITLSQAIGVNFLCGILFKSSSTSSSK